MVAMNEGQQIFPLIRQRGKILKIPAALARHLTPHAHVLAAIIMDRDTAKVQPIHVAAGTLGFCPGTVAQAQCLNDFFRCVALAGK